MPEPAFPALPPILDLAGIAIFALSGAIVAAREQQTFVTMCFFALITGVGGGTVRDMLIGAPVFWMMDPFAAPACLLMALVVWFAPDKWWSPRLLAWADAAGLAAYAVLGTVKALRFELPFVTAILMGIVTGCVGGIIRDVVAGRPSILMRHEIYVTAAALSASLAAIGWFLGFPIWLTWAVATGAGFALRGAAIQWSIGLPAYGQRDS
ncbi:hypothetical protein B2G71_14540 [Novosphingobium sp. PC22D]|uniref:trimeric intracellular cation channel family protein n=1 Tax=Novosphingobium sp. PC22D TaxID=1962403 RepID=UPI000BF15C23|nr:TRIC cation channel family protein [Novosphingobium sp. PC22D]PEQ11994.1 hypothetical protein B2G71_14540 [Novosphingobium sp. PC22D]